MNELYSKKMFVIDADATDVFFKHFQPFVDAIQADPLKAEAIIAMIPFGVYFKDLEGRYRVVNQIFEEISGKTHADIIGKRDKQIFPVNLAISLQNLYSRMIESKEALAEYIQTIDPEARATNYFAIAAPVKNNSGEIIGSAGFLSQLADISKNQDYYDEIEQQYHIILENTNDAISIIEDGMIRFHNPKLEELLGYNDEELRSIPFINHVHADDREAVAERYRIRVEGKFVLSPKAYRFIRKDGSVLWGSTSSVRIKRKHHDALLCISKDVTSKKNMEVQLNHARKLEAIGTLAGGIAHDFNNILGALISYTEASLYILPDDLNELRSNLSHILMAGQRAKQLIKQIINFSRPAEKEKRIVSIKSLIDDTLRLLRALLPSTIEIKKSLADDAGCIRVYEEQIQQVLMNLGSNSAHAMRSNGGVFQVSVNSIDLNQIKTFQETVIQPGKYIVINVGDTGGGIDPIILDRIFDPYFSTKKNEEGTGLGLAVSKEIIKNHHGAITVQNKPGVGCVFQIFLPQVNAEMTKQSTKESKKAFLKGTERILLVDDEEILVSALSLLLSMFGYQLTTETDSRKALRRFESNPDAFDIVITDQTMPGMTGKELAGKILAIRPGIPIILCTGYSDQVNKEEAFAAGINDFIMKPCKVNDLCISIRKLIDKV